MEVFKTICLMISLLLIVFLYIDMRQTLRIRFHPNLRETNKYLDDYIHDPSTIRLYFYVWMVITVVVTLAIISNLLTDWFAMVPAVIGFLALILQIVVTVRNYNNGLGV